MDVEVQLKELLLEKDKVAMVDLSQLTLVDVDVDAQLKESWLKKDKDVIADASRQHHAVAVVHQLLDQYVDPNFVDQLVVVEISEQLTLYTMETISIIMILDVDHVQVAKDQGAKRAVFDQ